MAAEHPDTGAPEDVDPREVGEAINLQIAHLRANVTSTMNKLSHVQRDVDEPRP